MKEWFKRLGDQLKNDPLKATAAGASVAGLGVASINLAYNRNRTHNAKKYQEDQLNAMNRLTDAMTKVNASTQHSTETQKHLLSELQKKEQQGQRQIPGNAQQQITNHENDGFFASFRPKNFSIEDGSYKGDKRTTFKPSAIGTGVGGAVGAGIGALIAHGNRPNANYGKGMIIGAAVGASVTELLQLLYKVADESAFHTPESKLSTIHLLQVIEDHYHVNAYEETREEEAEIGYEDADIYAHGKATNPRTDINDLNARSRGKSSVTTYHKERYIVPYSVDDSPKKSTVNITLRFGVLVMYINNPIRQELQIMNNALDDYCHYFENANYISRTVSKNCYLVELQVVGNEIPYLYTLVQKVIAPMLWGSIKVNFITDNAILSKGMVGFKRKDFSLKDDVITGAGVGAGVGGIAGLISKAGGNGGFGRSLAIIGIGTAVGASLGAIAHSIKSGADSSNRRATVDARLMNMVVDDLKASGFKEGVQFTRDPKRANELKVRVSIVVSRSSGEMNLLINMVADDRLKDLAKDVITRLPNSSAVTTSLEDKYNEITVTTIADNSANAGLIAGLCNYFIRSKYPVYLVEVG